MLHIMLNLGWSEEMCEGNMSQHIVFAHADVTPPVGRPYWITVSGLYLLLPCKLAKFSI